MTGEVWLSCMHIGRRLVPFQSPLLNPPSLKVLLQQKVDVPQIPASCVQAFYILSDGTRYLSLGD